MDNRFNSDGSINIEKLNKAYEKYYQKYDEEKEIKKLLKDVLKRENESRTVSKNRVKK